MYTERSRLRGTSVVHVSPVTRRYHTIKIAARIEYDTDDTIAAPTIPMRGTSRRFPTMLVTTPAPDAHTV